MVTVESASPNVGIFGYHYWRLRRRSSFVNPGTEDGWLTQAVFWFEWAGRSLLGNRKPRPVPAKNAGTRTGHPPRASLRSQTTPPD